MHKNKKEFAAWMNLPSANKQGGGMQDKPTRPTSSYCREETCDKPNARNA